MFQIKGLEYPESATTFDETIQFIEKCGKFITFAILKLFLNGVILLQCIGCFVTYIFTDEGNDAFVLPVPMWWVEWNSVRDFLWHKICWHSFSKIKLKTPRFPFDTKNPIGFLVACSFQYTHLGYECFFISNLVTLGLGSFILALTAIKDLKGILRSMNDQCTNNRSKRKRLEAYKHLREFVQMHSALKELSISQL